MGTCTPWGVSQYSTKIAHGIVSYGTAGHGGIHVCDTLNNQIPEYMRNVGGWYEEDCEWAIVAINFPQYFQKDYQIALNTFKNWNPDSYERYFDIELKPGESHVKDERMFLKAHENDYLPLAAWGDWHKQVPQGMVGVYAGKGGKRTDTAYFLVPANEYHQKPFVIDESKHIRIKEEIN